MPPQPERAQPGRASRSEPAPQPVSLDDFGKEGKRIAAPEAVDARSEMRQEIIGRYLWPEELTAIERGERPHRAEEAAQIQAWLRNVDVERTYRDDTYYAQYFGSEYGFTRLSRSRDGEELKHAFIERVVLEKEAKLRGTENAMRVLGISRMADGSLRFHGGDRPQEQGDVIDPVTAHALITGFETASWLKDPKERTAALGRVIRDSYRILGREAEFDLDVGDLIDVQDQEMVDQGPTSKEVQAARTEEHAALAHRLDRLRAQRDLNVKNPTLSESMRERLAQGMDQDIAELERQIAAFRSAEQRPEMADSEEVARLQQRIEQMRQQMGVNDKNAILSESMRDQLRGKIEADIAALEGEIGKRQGVRAPRKPEFPVEGVDITFEEFEPAPKGSERRGERRLLLPPEAVSAARAAYASESQKPSKWERLTKVVGGALRGMVDEARHFGRSLMDARWWKERAKTVLSAGVLDLYHFFKYGRAARVEAKAIDGAYQSLRTEIGLAPEQLESRIKHVVDEAEGRLMQRLITYKNEFGVWVMEKERLDAFREDAATRIRDRYLAQEDFDRKGMRDSILKTFDPGWYRRGRWGIMGLGLAANGLALALSRMGGRALPGPERWAVGPPKAPAGPESTITLGPVEQLASMEGTAWDTAKHFVRELKPGATSEEMVASIRKVLEHNGIYETHSGLWPNAEHLQAVTEGAKALGRTMIDAHQMPDGFPLRIPVEAIRTILGIGAKGAGAVA
ncbi:MAG: hypothetical protein Q7R80_02255 [bacterium]|nr:hypothetical protein [bacterium]